MPPALPPSPQRAHLPRIQTSRSSGQSLDVVHGHVNAPTEQRGLPHAWIFLPAGSQTEQSWGLPLQSSPQSFAQLTDAPLKQTLSDGHFPAHALGQVAEQVVHGGGGRASASVFIDASALPFATSAPASVALPSVSSTVSPVPNAVRPHATSDVAAHPRSQFARISGF